MSRSFTVSSIFVPNVKLKTIEPGDDMDVGRFDGSGELSARCGAIRKQTRNKVAGVAFLNIEITAKNPTDGTNGYASRSDHSLQCEAAGMLSNEYTRH